MKETREQIEKYLKRYKAADLKMLYELASRVLLSNTDFEIAAMADWGEVRSIIEDMVGKKIPFDQKGILSEEDQKVFQQFQRLDQEKKILKAKRVELLADLFSSDALFEGFCVVFSDSDDMLAILCEDYGCPGRYEALSADPVYQKRRTYVRMLTRYTMAAVNLYGVLHLMQLIDLIRDYEKFLRQHGGYTRTEGTYQNTLLFSPEWFCLYTLQHMAGNCIPEICSTMDGLVVHACFEEEVREEIARTFDYFEGLGRQVSEDDLSNFFDSVQDQFYYRILFDMASEKEMYLPSKIDFLKYENQAYFEESAAEKELRKYINRKYQRNFAAVARKVGITTEQCINDFMKELHRQASDVGFPEERDPDEFIQFVFGSMQGYGISFGNIDEANEFLGYAVKVMNSVRLWSNHGHTPDELARMHPVRPEDLTIVPGSSHMAKMMRESREEFESMGIHVDPDATGTEIPTFSFDSGIGGGMKTSVKKIYPNDPCPCGSGKKYKKCCGRK